MRTALPFPSRGLYVITDERHAEAAALLEAVRGAIAGGAAAVQYRCKASSENRPATARLLLEACRAAAVPLIVNDDVELALEIGADGVHLGQDDGSPEAARRRLGPSAIIGVSCYDSLQRAREAQEQGASYIAFGRFFPSRSKPGAPGAQRETLVAARQSLHLPIVAIGGITADNGRSLLAAGADCLAVIDAVFGDPAPYAAASRLCALFSQP